MLWLREFPTLWPTASTAQVTATTCGVGPCTTCGIGAIVAIHGDSAEEVLFAHEFMRALPVALVTHFSELRAQWAVLSHGVVQGLLGIGFRGGDLRQRG